MTGHLQWYGNLMKCQSCCKTWERQPSISHTADAVTIKVCTCHEDVRLVVPAGREVGEVCEECGGVRFWKGKG